jgi:hypothetical protein
MRGWTKEFKKDKFSQKLKKAKKVLKTAERQHVTGRGKYGF